MERLAIALLCALFGFGTGLFGWFCLSSFPPFDWGFGNWLRVSLGLALLSFLVGFWRPESAVEWLGALSQGIQRFSTTVLSWFRLLR